MNRCEWWPILQEKYPINYDARAEIDHTFRKMQEHFESHDKILISVSGGSDSDCIVLIVCMYFPEYLDKIHWVFVDTGLEYAATRRHLDDLEQKYGIEIEKIRGKSVVWAVKNYGIPILSKEKSQYISDYKKGCPYAKKRLFKTGSFGFSENERNLVFYLVSHNISVSKKCCDISKKNPIFDYIKENGIDLNVTGERKAEGGQRKSAHNSCYEEHKNGMHKYMPVWWWSNDTKAAFKDAEGIRYSDCYEVYGMKRTGCCGCPFNLDIAKDLQAMYQFEPQLYKACMSVFGQAYELTDRFNCRKKKCLPDAIQLRLF